MPEDVRALAALTIARVLGGQSLGAALEPALAATPDSERSLLRQLCYGSLRQAPRLQGLLEQMLEKPLRRKDADVRALLLMGLYQLDSMRIPDHAAVATTVDAVEHLGKPWARGLTNAVLRRYLRERDTLVENLDEGARASHPAWLFGKLHKQWPQHAAGIIEANNTQPPMTLRVNSARLSRQTYLDTLATAGIGARPGTISACAVTLEQPIDVEALPGFAAGDASVQDEAAQVAAYLLDAQAGERVLDACAAPGGKTCHILELQPALGEMVAEDVDATRLQKVAENLERLGLKATLAAADAADSANHHRAESFDRILVDAPCSGTGVIRRHPDIKTLRQPSDIPAFAGQQLEILQGAWPLLRRGGTLLYATCSVLKEENRALVTRFLELASDAEVDPIEVAYGEQLDGALQILPSVAGSDGLFYCRLLRR